mgnify:FL=1
MALSTYKPIILFDGYCNLCSSSVIFVLKRERGDVFRYTSLQSDFAGRLLSDMGLDKDIPDSIVLVEEGEVYTRSTAALRIARKLKPLWSALYAFRVVPKFIRDPVYDWIARNRYKWFGKRSTCYVPNQDVKHKFLDK